MCSCDGAISPLFFQKEIKCLIITVLTVIIPLMVTIEKRFHPFSFRTRKLSFSSPNILGWKRPGKSGHRHHIIKTSARAGFFDLIYMMLRIFSHVLISIRAPAKLQDFVGKSKIDCINYTHFVKRK